MAQLFFDFLFYLKQNNIMTFIFYVHTYVFPYILVFLLLTTEKIYFSMKHFFFVVVSKGKQILIAFIMIKIVKILKKKKKIKQIVFIIKII